MVRLGFFIVGFCFAVALQGFVVAGPLVPLGPPDSTFKTLDEVSPGTPVTLASLTLTITEPGYYYLVENLTWEGDGAAITVNATDVTIDLRGFRIDGVSASAGTGRRGIQGNADRLSVRNGSIIRMSGGGIRGTTATVEDVGIEDCREFGIWLGALSVVRRCHVRQVTRISGDDAAGIWTESDSVVEDSVVVSILGTQASSGAIGIRASIGSIIRRCKVYAVIFNPGESISGPRAVGIFLAGGSGVVEDCLVESVSSNANASEANGIIVSDHSKASGNLVTAIINPTVAIGISGISSQVEGNQVRLFSLGPANSQTVGILVTDRGSASQNRIVISDSATSGTGKVYVGCRVGANCVASGNAITISGISSSDPVTIRGIEINGADATIYENNIRIPLAANDASSTIRMIHAIPGAPRAYAGRNRGNREITWDLGWDWTLIPSITLGTGNDANIIY